ncbi:subtilase family protein [Lyngbya aestuarii BL J]|uniref:Subtilase family protein n=1 Tax=Lyngbya aestuarii BL J TaxID=1348334 RepID=U7QQA6_9CYAN|nr:S8 family serine peptidase [Lyngbya aestuarii]ERT08601.1 subtilase family protein [Lyngbya aestuarii BL J]
MGLFKKGFGFSSSKRQSTLGFQSQSKKPPSQETFILEPILTPSGLVDGGDDSPDPIIIESELLDEIESELNSEVETQSEEDLTPVEVSNLDEVDEVEISFITELEELDIEDNSETSEDNLAESNQEITSDDTESSLEKPANSETEITESSSDNDSEINQDLEADLESSSEVEEGSTQNITETESELEKTSEDLTLAETEVESEATASSSEETSEDSTLEESQTEETASKLEEIFDESTLEEESEIKNTETTIETELDESTEETELSTHSETEHSNDTDTVNESENDTDSNAEIIEEIVSSPVDFNFDSGIFTVGENGEIGIDYLFDGGGFGWGEVAIFSLEGMEELDLSLEEFIKEASNRALSDSELGHVVISDGHEGAKFSGGMGGEADVNRGEYLGVKTFNMRPGDKFAMMLIPNGKVQQVFDNPSVEGTIRPLFSLSTANPEDGFQLGQIADVTGDGNTFVFEDLRVDNTSDHDYNDIIFQVRGASGEAVNLDEVINPNKDWRSSDMGQALIEYAQPYITPDEPIVEIENNLSNLLTDLEGLLDEGESETEIEIDEEVSNSEVVETEVLDEIVEVSEEEKSQDESTGLVESTELKTEESEFVEIEDSLENPVVEESEVSENKENLENPVIKESVVVEIADNLDYSVGESTATESEQIEVEESLASSIVEETEESVVTESKQNLETYVVEESEIVEIADNLETLDVEKSVDTEIEDNLETSIGESTEPELEETEVEENLSTAVVEETEELSVVEIEDSGDTSIVQQTKESVVIEIEDNLETSIVEETEQSEAVELVDNFETSVVEENLSTPTVEEAEETGVIESEENYESDTSPTEQTVIEDNSENSTGEETKELEVIEIADNSETPVVEEAENSLETIPAEESSQELEETELQETSEASLIEEVEQSEIVAVENNLDNPGVEESEETEFIDIDNSSETSILPVYTTEFEDVENSFSETSPTSTSESPTVTLVNRLENLTYNLQNQTLSETPVNSNLIQQLERLTDRLKTQAEFNPNPPVSSTTLQLIERLETQLITQPVLPTFVEPSVDFEFPAENQPLIGIIDTGFSGDNPDIDYSRITWGSDKVDGDLDPSLTPGEGNEHGTHILGLIAAKQNNGIGIDGINNNAPIWAGRAIGSGRWAESLVEFVDAAVESGQPNAVVNLSLDLTQIDAEGNVTTRYEFTPLEMAALEYARQNNVLVAVAAGNEGGVMSALGQASQQFDNIITVGSAQQIDGETSAWQGFDRAEYSNYGSGLDIVADSGTLENPVISTVGDGIGAMDGTSVATAKVTGAISQVWAANPELSYRQVIDIIKATATDLQDANPDVETGAGLLNIAAAIHLAKTTKPEEESTQDLQFIPLTWSGEGLVTPMERAANPNSLSPASSTANSIQQVTWDSFLGIFGGYSSPNWLNFLQRAFDRFYSPQNTTFDVPAGRHTYNFKGNSEYRFIMENQGSLNLALRNTALNSQDFEFELLKANGQRITPNLHDLGDNFFAFNNLQKGNYVAKIKVKDAKKSLPYETVFNLDQAGGSLSKARNLGNIGGERQTVNDHVGIPSGDSDYYKFSTDSAPRILQFAVRNENGDGDAKLDGDVGVFLYDKSGKNLKLAISQNKASTYDTYNLAPNSDYYVQIKAREGQATNYHLVLNLLNYRPINVPAGRHTYDLKGNSEYRFTMENQGSLNLALTNTALNSQDFEFELQKANGQLITPDIRDLGDNFFAFNNLQKGNYVAKIKVKDGKKLLPYETVFNLDQAGGSLSTARNLGHIGGKRITVNDHVGIPSVDHDYYKFSTDSAPRILQFAVRNENGDGDAKLDGDVGVFLYDKSGKNLKLAISQNKASIYDTYNLAPNSDYYVLVKSRPDQATNYQLVLNLKQSRPGGSSAWQNPLAGSLYYIYPLNEFGTPRQISGTHNGIDLSTGNSTPPIKAAKGGKVVIAYNGNGWNDGYGKYVKIDHGDGTETRYAHLSNVSVQQGSNVSAGTVIGNVGSTGNSSGNHLHFEIRVNGVPQNPRNYIDF